MVEPRESSVSFPSLSIPILPLESGGSNQHTQPAHHFVLRPKMRRFANFARNENAAAVDGSPPMRRERCGYHSVETNVTVTVPMRQWGAEGWSLSTPRVTANPRVIMSSPPPPPGLCRQKQQERLFCMDTMTGVKAVKAEARLSVETSEGAPTKGDGSQSLGGALGTAALLVKKEQLQRHMRIREFAIDYQGMDGCIPEGSERRWG
eukprot:CAMPEP_0183295566 /NCGR_PEP_ID=MMETSP0160_2-20130417/3483_1 /TAXON_ID=2839 ORGANISM="Odontella Sinensis, Strain Grunow 1884" /NCGR_SAMPLE_ID=MMETSP0160_2 /ASSEMBLY_ACC=CAM_ASM_000250 /LENGTH=205 /DNA_ID=CAMNT_0025457071 /DNA_START=105 /DNA_END=718 /DNA_ORIENTATION=+